jgi:hypothetical protein
VRFRLDRAAARANDARPSVEQPGGAAGAAAPLRINDAEETRRRAVEAWLLLRSKEAEKTGGQFRDQQTSERSARERDATDSQRQRQDDLAL